MGNGEVEKWECEEIGRWKREGGKVGEEEIRKQELGIFKQAVEGEEQNGLMWQKRCEGTKVSEKETAGE